MVWWFGQKGKGSSSRAHTPVRSKWEDGPPASILKNTTEAQEQGQEDLTAKEIEEIKGKLSGLKPVLETLKEHSTEASQLVGDQVKALEMRLQELTERPIQDRIRSLLDKKKDREKKLKEGNLAMEKVKMKQTALQDYLESNMKDLNEITESLKKLGVDTQTSNAPVGEEGVLDPRMVDKGNTPVTPVGDGNGLGPRGPKDGDSQKSPLGQGGGIPAKVPPEDPAKAEEPGNVKSVHFEDNKKKRLQAEGSEDMDMEEGIPDAKAKQRKEG